MTQLTTIQPLPGNAVPAPPQALFTSPAIARDERREHLTMVLLLMPALLMVVVLLVLPLLWLGLQSVQGEEGLSLASYTRIFTEAIYWDTFGTTLQISVIVTVLSILLGFPIAYAAARTRGLLSSVILLCVILPFWTSVLVRSYAWLVLLQRRGVVNQTLIDLGVISRPLELVHNATGTVIGTLHVMLPFMVLPLYSGMKKIPNDQLLASDSLGAGRRCTFRRNCSAADAPSWCPCWSSATSSSIPPGAPPAPSASRCWPWCS